MYQFKTLNIILIIFQFLFYSIKFMIVCIYSIIYKPINRQRYNFIIDSYKINHSIHFKVAS